MVFHSAIPKRSEYLPQTNSSSFHLEKSPSKFLNETETAEDLAVHQLLPIIAECFIIILCGYVCGRLQYITSTEIKGLTVFTSHFALPALIFLNLSTIRLNDVRWFFILGIVLGKSLIFVLVAASTGCFHQPFSLALAGLYGILCTQGSDFSFAYPVVKSVFGHTHPSYPGYMYIIAPFSHVLFNPVGFLLMETEGVRYYGTRSHSKFHRYCETIISIACGMIKNPCVVMTIAGSIVNALSSGSLPFVLEQTLKMLSSAFSASILFLLGFAIYEASSKINAFNLTSALLLLVKMSVSPFVLYMAVKIICQGCHDKESLANYAFLYGTIPSGPIVLLFATQYGLATEMLASTLVLNNVLSAPLIFLAVKLIEFDHKHVLSAMLTLDNFIIYVSLFSTCSAACVIFTFLIRGFWKRIPHFMVFNLSISQIFVGIGVLVWKFQITPYVQLAGVITNRVWTAFFAISLMILRTNNIASIVNWSLIINTTILGTGITSIILIIMIITGIPLEEITSNNTIQGTVAVVTLISCVLSLLALFGYSRHLILKLPLRLNKEDSEKSDLSVHPQSSSDGLKLRCLQFEKPTETISRKEALLKILPVFLALEWRNIELKKENPLEDVERFHRRKISEVQQGEEVNEQDKLYRRHVTLLIFLIVSMTTNLFTLLWKLFSATETPVFVFLRYLDCLQSYGQGVIIFCLFNVSIESIWSYISRFRKRPPTSHIEEVVCTRF